MSEIQVWVAMYLAVGCVAVGGLPAGSGHRAAAIIFWPLTVLVHFWS